MIVKMQYFRVQDFLKKPNQNELVMLDNVINKAFPASRFDSDRSLTSHKNHDILNWPTEWWQD